MKRLLICLFLQFIFLTNITYCDDVPFPEHPEYITQNVKFYSTGAAFVDIDDNGFLDLVFSNGNDMETQQEIISGKCAKNNPHLQFCDPMQWVNHLTSKRLSLDCKYRDGKNHFSCFLPASRAILQAFLPLLISL